MAKPMELRGRTAVVTGAAGGIGRAIAVCLAQRGCNLALADVNQAGLAQTASLTSTVSVTTQILDVADRESVAAFPSTIAAAHPSVDILVNNAGVALGGYFKDISEADFEWLFEINFWGVVRMTRAFLPLLHASDDARIVNLSSIYGVVAPPGQTAYAASKFAVRGFSQSLRHELAGSKIGVTIVHPGGVATSIANNARVPANANPDETARGLKIANALLKLPPERAGEIIVKAIEQRRGRVLVGADAKIVSVVERLTPVSYWPVLQRLSRRL